MLSRLEIYFLQQIFSSFAKTEATTCRATYLNSTLKKLILVFTSEGVGGGVVVGDVRALIT